MTDTYTFEKLLGPDNLRKLAQRTVETYPDAWKVIHEALQNAKDAIRRKKAAGRIKVVLNVSSQTVSVADNGVGFPQEPHLLGFGGTDKDSLDDWCVNGRQGVGLKAVILSTSTFRLRAITEGREWVARIDEAASFLDGGQPSVVIEESVASDKPSGTEVTYSFQQPLVTDFVTEALNQVLPSVGDHLARGPRESLQLALEIYFRTRSYAGDVNPLLDLGESIPIDVDFTVLADGKTTGNLHSELGEVLAEKPVRFAFPCRHWDLREAVDRTLPGRPRPSILQQAIPPAGRFGRLSDSFVYFNTFTREEEYAALLANPNMRRQVSPEKYQRLFEQLRGIYVVVGSRGTLTRYLAGPPRQLIAANGVPSAHVLAGPTRGGEATYVSNNIHIVLNLDSHLNYGKQTISNTRLLSLASAYFADSVRATLRNVAISIVGSQQVTTSADDIEDLAAAEQDVIARPVLAGGRLNFKRVPRDENALIAIFFELIGRGALVGYDFYSLSQRARYDGRAVMKLSNQEKVAKPSVDGDLKTVEFKLELGHLIADFENEIKFAQEVQLLVVWEDTLGPDITDYQVVGIEHTEDADRRMDGVDKVLHCKREQRMIQMLVLKDLVERRVVNGGA